jgi:beta-glucosidase
MFLFSLLVALTICSYSIANENGSKDKDVARSLIAQMTLDEKVGMLHGLGWIDTYSQKSNPVPYTGFAKGVKRLGIPDLKLNDGPQGFRSPDYPGSTTAFPSAGTVGFTWDLSLIYSYGQAMGEEFIGKGANVFLGPGLNVARVPLNGRNFEYISGGDPYLGASFARPLIEGVQSNKGLIANAKHFIFNNQEIDRTTDSSIVSEKAKWEIFYPPFQGAVDAKVGSFMCSYNKIDGDWSCENPQTLKNDLKETIGFEGWVMSDWGATHSLSIEKGLDQEMPSSTFFGKDLKRSVEKGEISEDALDESVERILISMIRANMIQSTSDEQDTGSIDAIVTTPEHQELAQKLSAESTVLLQNTNNVLPITKNNNNNNVKIALIGKNLLSPVIGGGGSGSVFPNSISTPYNAIMNELGLTPLPIEIDCDSEPVKHNIGYKQPSCLSINAPSEEACKSACKSYAGCTYWTFIPGDGGHCLFAPTDSGHYISPRSYSGQCKRIMPSSTFDDKISNCNNGYCIAINDGSNMKQAQQLAKEADIVIIGVGTTSAEGNDRSDLSFAQTGNYCQLMPSGQDELISQIADVVNSHTNIIVTMTCPGACLTPWKEHVHAIVHSYMPGQAYGVGLSDILFGHMNPSAKLTFTMPMIENEVAFTEQQYPGIDLVSNYTEGLLVDYRYYHSMDKKPSFAFGHGLSYTIFDYTSMNTMVQQEQDNTNTNIELEVTNSGKIAGKEVVQVYLTFPMDKEPPRQLKSFYKTKLLQPNDREKVSITLSQKDMSIWCCKEHKWKLPSGTFQLHVGSSSDDIRLTQEFTL